MLNSLHVKNLALIEETEVEFGEGLNILTGETGAGKSIVIGSINLALGAKADRELIRTGKEFALVELIFSVDSPLQREKMKELGLTVEDDVLIISRKITEGKSFCKVNGETVTARQLKELAECVINVYGQHEHQSLTSSKKQFSILDDFAGKELAEIKRQLSGQYKIYKELLKELEQSDTEQEARQKNLSLAKFEIQEIEEARLKAGEDEVLERDYRKMGNARKIMDAAALCIALVGDEEGDSVSVRTGRALRELKTAASYDETLNELAGQLQEIESLLHDFNREIRDYVDSLSFDAHIYAQTEERLNLLNRLKAKYGNSIEEILAYCEMQKSYVNKLEDYDAYLAGLWKKIRETEKTLFATCEKASDLRREKAVLLEQKMTEALHDLNFMDVKFKIQIDTEKKLLREEGFDTVEFQISTNPGEPLKPLSGVASGGELSRIMLGLKTVMAQRDGIQTLIFDEIDAGISGKTAWQVSKKLSVLGKDHQVICITHLPQISSMADVHFKIEKKQEENRTKTDIYKLDEKGSVEETARLLGGDTLTEAALVNAREMKELALQEKQY